MDPASKQASMFKDSKRNRRPTSCEQCRLRKYANNAIRHRKAAKGSSSSSSNASNSNVGERLQRVENLVFELVNGGGGGIMDLSNGDHDVFVDHGSQVGRTRNHGHGGASRIETTATHGDDMGKSFLHRPTEQSTHWLAILDDIKEVREQLSQSEIFTPEDNDMNNEQAEEELDLALGPMELPKFQDIIQSLPPRPICDKILAQYFNSSLILPIIHPTKFLNEYEKFWHNPARAPVLWVGVLFSILTLALAINQSTGEGTIDVGSQATLSVRMLRNRTAQCLMMGNYTNATSYAVEAMVLLFLGKYVGKSDSSFDSWFLMGNIIRLAMRMGYHRDPKYRRDISLFEGEMRRRRWHAILQLDLLLSFQMGMPSMIPVDCSDTELPRNFKDSDIYPNVDSLPSPRPLSDHTPVLYTIVKGGIMNVFRKVIAHTQSSITWPPPYPRTIELDNKLRETYAGIPDDFKMKPIKQSIIDSSSMIINRCTVELLFLKGIMVLHRRYLNTERFDAQYDYSRRACVDAALTILSRQADLHEATQPHGRLYEDRWMVSSLTAHDFLLASMVICLELSLLIRSPNNLVDSSPSLINSPSRFGKLLDALLDSQRIWASKSAYSKEARTASLTLQLMLEKVQGSSSPYSLTNGSTNDPMSTKSSSDDAMTYANIGDGELPFAGTMTDMIDGSENLDWAILDQYLQNTGSLMTPLDMPDDGWDLLNMDSC
ncbi:hypothetical protein UA08_02199 [Talaromyces atroroseus]|uniref:Xylanolytic transcriptional activator regulatory domain-containing protein n=1 Tax=Talaromyces atroroseus TaxID=1441469 RepID=A0A225B306_TALAT|nr:hypothetical protein UA08_02199 [Talaromyces atroroseus]OKL61666.1 hypothetical protein UA08_02199 [Talaromyces atroroseus]